MTEHIFIPVDVRVKFYEVDDSNLPSSEYGGYGPTPKRRKLLADCERQPSAQSESTHEWFTLARVELDFNIDLSKLDLARHDPFISQGGSSTGNHCQPVRFQKSKNEYDGGTRYEVSTEPNQALFDVHVPTTTTTYNSGILDLVTTIPAIPLKKGRPRWELCSTLEITKPARLRTLLRLQRENTREWPTAFIYSHAVLPSLKDLSIEEAPLNWSPKIFYESVYTPQSDGSTALPPLSDFECQMFPFQKRAVAWMLGREGIAITDGGLEEQETDLSHNEVLPHGFQRIRDLNGRPAYLSHLLGTVCTDNFSLLQDTCAFVKGGVLAEEMGLGKTVELLALIRSHPQNVSPRRPESQHPTSPKLKQCPATLIITPPSILEQWKTEIQIHTPKLKVLVYNGANRLDDIDRKSLNTPMEMSDSLEERVKSILCTYDIVLTTYNVLSKEMHFANEIPDRSTRFGNVKRHQRSPLVTLLWWRVVLDEAQMIESGVSNAAKVARLIPRRNAWAVSGTPVRKDAEDLRGLLIFLGIEPYASSQKLWDRTVTHHPQVFREIFRKIALRHTKERVKHEITLPPQKRVVVNMSFGQVEEQNYSRLFQDFCNQLGVDLNGQPLPYLPPKDNTSSESIMRSWLTRLRQICLHPEIGHHNRLTLGRRRALRTMDQVLDIMMEQNETAILTEERELLMSKVRRGQILEHAGDSRGALEIWAGCLNVSEDLVNEYRRQFSMLVGKNEDCEKFGRLDNTVGLEKTTAQSRTKSETGEHELHQVIVLRQRLRSAIEMEHLCTFFVANAYFQLKSKADQTTISSDELNKKEATKYDHAKVLRKELLVESERKAEKWMGMVKKSSPTNLHCRGSYETIEATGQKVGKLRTRLTDLIRDLNRHADFVAEIRRKLRELLSLPLVDQEDSQDIQGDEYETSTKQQDDLYVYVDIFRATVFDRHEVLTGQRNFLVNHEMDRLQEEANLGAGHAPQLLLELSISRQQCRRAKESGSIRGLLREMKELKTALRTHLKSSMGKETIDLEILTSLLDALQGISNAENKAWPTLEKELEVFTDATNARLEYYRQLQRISDTVQPYEADLSADERQAMLAAMLRKEASIEAQATKLRSKGRYYWHLKQGATGDDSTSTQFCTICQSDFGKGMLLSCGHAYCRDCWRMWWKTNHYCPTCKKKLTWNDLHRIVERSQQIVAEEETLLSQPSSSSIASSSSKASTPGSMDGIYTGVQASTLNEIKDIDIPNSYGTKIDSMTRHVLWLREHDPGAKSVIFSQYRDFLKFLQKVFTKAKIGCATIEEKDGVTRFKGDVGVECFFLHAQAQASGLNLVEATHVFLCEPMLNTALELQAIARVHRIGQKLPTTVWMYIVEGTVEKAIYEMSTQRRLSHIIRVEKTTAASAPEEGGEGPSASEVEDELDPVSLSNEQQIEAANSREMQEVALSKLLNKGGKNATGDEVVAQQDLWKCLFSQRPKGLDNDDADDADDGVAESGDRSSNGGHFEGPVDRISQESAENRSEQAHEQGPRV